MVERERLEVEVAFEDETGGTYGEEAYNEQMIQHKA